MKKCLTFFLFTFLIHSHSYATSGACSYHNGVNCASGSTYTGNVLCNDGWINSSVNFNDTDECKDTDNCPQIVYGLSCITQSDYDRLKTQVNNSIGSQGAINARRGLLGSDFGAASTDNVTSVGQDQLNNCSNSILLYTRMVDSRNQCLENKYKTQIEQSSKVSFDKHFDTIIERMPDYKNIVNKEVIRLLAQKSENGNKTISQLIIETYSDKLPIIATSSTPQIIKTSTSTPVIWNYFVRVLRIGMKGEDVKQLQKNLQKQGYLPTFFIPSNFFGQMTKNAVIQFQKENNIQPAQGLVGSITQAKLLSL